MTSSSLIDVARYLAAFVTILSTSFDACRSLNLSVGLMTMQT